jgi:hypothetical protein
MISVTPAPKFFIVCQSCNRDNQKTWRLEVKTVFDERTSQGTVITLCTQCLLTLGVKVFNATIDVKENPDGSEKE